MAEPAVSAPTVKSVMSSSQFLDDFDCLAFEDVSRYFGRMRALSHVSFSCATGEIVGVLGPNGAGKSTLLALAATLMSPSAGAYAMEIMELTSVTVMCVQTSECCHTTPNSIQN